MQFQVTIDETLRPGIARAREACNLGVPAEVQTGVDAEGAPVMGPNPLYFATDEAFMVAQSLDLARQYNPSVVAPPPPPPSTGGSGKVLEVTKRQGRQALILTGRIDLVQPAIDAIADPVQRAIMQSEWDDSQTFQRNRATLIQMGYAIGMTDQDLDDLFAYAATLS